MLTICIRAATYLSDLWLFDTDTYKWKQIETKDVKGGPVARSGFSMIPCAEGAIVYGMCSCRRMSDKLLIALSQADIGKSIKAARRSLVSL